MSMLKLFSSNELEVTFSVHLSDYYHLHDFITDPFIVIFLACYIAKLCFCGNMSTSLIWKLWFCLFVTWVFYEMTVLLAY